MARLKSPVRTQIQAQVETQIPLTQLGRGQQARVSCMRSLDPSDVAFLEAMGLGEATCLRLCRSSSSCILDIGETGECRIAVARSIAERILVGPVEIETAAGSA